MKRQKIKIPYWVNWIISTVLFAVVFIIFYGLIQFVLFSEAKLNSFGEWEHLPVSTKPFNKEAMLWLMFMFSGISFISGYVIHGWLQIEEIKEDETN